MKNPRSTFPVSSGHYISMAAMAVLLAATQELPAQPLVAYSFGSSNATTVAGGMTATPVANGSLNTFNVSGAGFGYPHEPVLRVIPSAGSTSQDLAVSNNTYFSFTLNANPLFQFTASNLTFNIARGGTTTPRGYVVRSSVDGFVTNLAAADVPTVRPALTPVSIALADAFQNLTNVTFRIYSYSPNNTSSELDDLAVNGIVAPVATASVGAMSYVQQPGNTLPGSPITPEVQVEAFDTNGQPVAAALIMISLSSGTGTLGGTLSQYTDINGIAHFNDLTVNQSGAKVLTATAGTGTAAPTNSSSFTIIMPVSGLAFTTQPGLATTGSSFGQQPVVKTVDQSGNPTKAGLPAVQIVNLILTNSSGTLLGTTSYNIGTSGSNGVLTFTNLEIDVAGSGNQLVALSTGIPSNPVFGAVLWLDADDSSTLTANATKVQAWKNKGLGGAGTTGTNLWFTQTNTALQPTLAGNALNGRPVVHFNDHGSGNGAGNDFLVNPSGSYTNSGSQMTYFIVTRQTANNSDWRGPVSFSANGEVDGYGVSGVAILADGSQPAPYPMSIQRHHQPTPMQADIPVPAAGTAFMMTFVDNAGDASLYSTDINGLYQTNGANIVNGITNYSYAITDVAVGGRLEPAPTIVDNGWPGDIAEVLVYNTALNSTDRTSVENYLKNKWFVAGSTGLALSNALSATFTVQSSGGGIAPRQGITGVTLNNGGSVTLSYATTAGFTYHVETTTNLASPSWTTVPGSTTNAVGTTATFTDSNATTSSQRFYRTVSP
jgi:hypothetical protein